MANITIVSTTNSIKVDFGVYSSVLGMSKGVWRKNNIRFILSIDGCVNALDNNGAAFVLVAAASINSLIVDLVDGVAPTSNSDLYDKLTALIA